MARRRELNDVADGLLNSFISRNNDVYGYWGIGKLYSQMLRTISLKINIDLIDKTISPSNDEYLLLISDFSNRLYFLIDRKKLHKKHVTKAEIVLSGIESEQQSRYGNLTPNRMNCKVIITDDLLKAHVSETNIWCREHNPATELKSGRHHN